MKILVTGVTLTQRWRITGRVQAGMVEFTALIPDPQQPDTGAPVYTANTLERLLYKCARYEHDTKSV